MQQSIGLFLIITLLLNLIQILSNIKYFKAHKVLTLQARAYIPPPTPNPIMNALICASKILFEDHPLAYPYTVVRIPDIQPVMVATLIMPTSENTSPLGSVTLTGLF